MGACISGQTAVQAAKKATVKKAATTVKKAAPKVAKKSGSGSAFWYVLVSWDWLLQHNKVGSNPWQGTEGPLYRLPSQCSCKKSRNASR